MDQANRLIWIITLHILGMLGGGSEDMRMQTLGSSQCLSGTVPRLGERLNELRVAQVRTGRFTLLAQSIDHL